MDRRGAVIGGGIRAGQVAMGTPASDTRGVGAALNPVANERLPAPRPGLVTEISDDDYRCVWRPCPALEEQQCDPQDNP